MKYYCVAEISVRDRAWVRSYTENVTKMVEAFGGRYLARTPNFEILESAGTKPQFLLLIEWPSRESAKAFYDSEEYRPYQESRLAGSEGGFYLVAGEDINGTARIT
jgi:uncharacterized protein (DUF1330 family)